MTRLLIKPVQFLSASDAFATLVRYGSGRAWLFEGFDTNPCECGTCDHRKHLILSRPNARRASGIEGSWPSVKRVEAWQVSHPHRKKLAP